MIRIIQIACIVVTVAILWGLRSAFVSFANWNSPGWIDGFLCGVAAVVLIYLLIIWIDPSSRPRGTAVQQKRFDDRVH